MTGVVVLIVTLSLVVQKRDRLLISETKEEAMFQKEMNEAIKESNLILVRPRLQLHKVYQNQ